MHQYEESIGTHEVVIVPKEHTNKALRIPLPLEKSRHPRDAVFTERCLFSSRCLCVSKVPPHIFDWKAMVIFERKEENKKIMHVQRDMF